MLTRRREAHSRESLSADEDDCILSDGFVRGANATRGESAKDGGGEDVGC